MLAGPALAQAPAPAPADPFVGGISLGYLATQGNTDSTNANADFEVTWDLDGPW
jgi:putative salt-induced outer membrane protein YdiY